MPGLKHVTLSVSTLLFLSQNIALASEYPAPPGHYGQDKILQNSTLNTGKGSPYISILPADQTRPDKKPETIQEEITDKNIPALPKPVTKQQVMPAQASNPVMQSTVSSLQLPPAAKPEPIALPVTAQPVYSPAPETAPSRFREQIYPDAKDLSHHYKLSRELPFGQWGEQLPETQQPHYDYPPAQRGTPSRFEAAPMNRTFQGSPDLANKMFNPQRRKNNSFINPGSIPVDMMDQYWGGNRSTDFMPPFNNQLKTFDQFPVPQNLYGPSSINQPVQGGNRQYFRQIPKEEIIYPPHYPGNR